MCAAIVLLGDIVMDHDVLHPTPVMGVAGFVH